MRPLAVSLPIDDTHTAALHRASLASVPSRFTVTTGAADVVVVSGRSAGWPDAAGAAVADGARALLIAAPKPVPAGRVRRLARQAADTGVLVAVDNPFVSDLAWSTALPRMRQDLDDAVLLESVTGVDSHTGAGPLDSALLAQVALVRRLVPRCRLRPIVAPSAGHYLVTGSDDANGIAVTLSGVRTCRRDEHGLQLHLVGLRRRWFVRLHTGAPAGPTEITLLDAAGQHTDRPRYESGHRAGWRTLHNALANGTSPPYSVDDLAADLEFVEELLGD